MPIPNIFESDVSPRVCAAGEVIFRAGDPGDVMYIIRDGQAEIRADGAVLETVGANGVLGEMALIDGAPRSADAVAVTDCTLIPIDQARFTFMVAETPFFSIEIMRIMSARLRRRSA